MASNELPNRLDELFALCHRMITGLNTYQVALDIKQNTKAAMEAVLGTSETADFNYGDAVGNKTPLQDAQDAQYALVKAFLSDARGVLVHFLGGTYTQQWGAAGFPDNSTAVPDTIPKCLELTDKLKLYFTAHPTQENAPLNVTAAQAGALHTSFNAAIAAVDNGDTVAGQKKDLRDTSVTALRKRMTGLIAELTQLMENDDGRWYAFGLNPPAGATMPDVPTGLALTTGPPTIVLAAWDVAARAAHYRLFKQVVGVDPAFVFVDRFYDPSATVTGLPTAATVKLHVTSVNDAGESAPSADAQVVVP